MRVYGIRAISPELTFCDELQFSIGNEVLNLTMWTQTKIFQLRSIEGGGPWVGLRWSKKYVVSFQGDCEHIEGQWLNLPWML